MFAASYASIAYLVDSLLHDARNPLNAMAINLEVLNEKLRDGAGVVPPSMEKNIRAMREQVFRVDTILRSFAGFLAPKATEGEALSLSQEVEHAQKLLGYVARKRRLRVKAAVADNVRLKLTDIEVLRFFVLQSLLRALCRSDEGQEVSVTVACEGGSGVLRVEDAGAGSEPNPLVRAAFESLGAQHGVEVRLDRGRCELKFPVA
jgi:signal transduction histidine kinase